MKRSNVLVTKRLVALLLLLCLLPIAPLMGQAQEKVSNLFGTSLLDQPSAYSDFDNIQSVAVLRDTLYIRTTYHLYTFTKGEEQAQKRLLLPSYNHKDSSLDGAVAEGQPYIKTILSDGEKLYGLDFESQNLYTLVLTGDKLDFSDPLKLDLSAFIQGEAPHIYYQDPAWALMDGGRLYLRQRNYEGEPKDLISFDLKTGEKKEHQVAFLQSAAPYKDGKLIALLMDPNDSWDPNTNTQKKPAIVAFDPGDDSITVLGSYVDCPDSQEEQMSIYYDAKADALFTYTDTDVYRYDAPFTKGSLIGYLPMYTQFPVATQGGILPFGEDKLAISFGMNIFLREKTEKGLEGFVPLVLGSGMDLMDGRSIMRVLMQMDKVVLRRVDLPWGSMDAETLASRFLTGQVNVDLMPINLYRFDLDSLIKKGYLLDLSDNAGIKEYVDGLFPNLTTAYTKDGKIFAAPAQLMVSPVAYKEEAFKASGLAIPKTFEELLDLAEAWVGGLHEEHPDYLLFSDGHNLKRTLIDLFITTYINSRLGAGEDLVFDTPLFRDTMNRILTIQYGDFGAEPDWNNPAARAMIEENWEKKPLIESNVGYEPQYMTGVNNQGERRSLPLPLPFGADGVYYKEADLTLFTVLSTTQYPEQAKRFIELYLKGLDPVFTMSLSPDQAFDLPNPNYERAMAYNARELEKLEERYAKAEGAQKSDLEVELKYLRERHERNKENLKMLATKADIQSIHSMIQQLYLLSGLQNAQRMAHGEGYDTFQQFLDGAINLDQYIKIMDDKLRLVRMEYQ